MQRRQNLKVLLTVTLLVAMEIVLNRFLSINTPILKIGFGFVPLAITGMLFGPKWGFIAGAMADFIGASLFPIGAYFPGFTLSVALRGMNFGLFLHKRKNNWFNLILVVLINNILIGLLLTSFWLHIISGTAFLALVKVRVIQFAILIPVQFIVLRVMQHPVNVHLKKQFAFDH